jgi:putative hydrolase of the HAD superfamily
MNAVVGGDATAGGVTALFWDVGGVILSNGWDTAARARAVERFKLDREEMEQKHASEFPAFEMGEISLGEYLTRVIFCRPQPFSKEEFTAFVFAQSSENIEARAVLDELTQMQRYLLATLNNEGLELNAYRIATYDLRRNFTAFFSSCYLHMRKPDQLIYDKALQITARTPRECILIDDRLENLEGARKVGMQTIHFQTAVQLRAELAAAGVTIASEES